MNKIAWLLFLSIPTFCAGCASKESLPNGQSPEYAAIDIKNESAIDKRSAGPYVLHVGQGRIEIPEVFPGKGAGITLLSIQRSTARFLFEAEGIRREIDVTAKGTRLDMPEHNTSLVFQFRCSSIPPFEKDARISDEVTVFRLSNSAVGNEFHGTPISSQMTGNDPKLASSFISAFSDEKVVGIRGADCSPADYGIRVVVAGRTVECWFSFECGWMYLYENDLEYSYGFSPDRAEDLRKKMEVFLHTAKDETSFISQ